MGCLSFDLLFIELSVLMTRILYSLVLQDSSTDAGPSGVPLTVDMSLLARVNEAGAKMINYLCSQLANIEQRLKQVQGVADVAASKRKLATDREEYLIEELGKTAKDILCKWKPPSHVMCVLRVISQFFAFHVGIEPHPNTERQWVEGKIVACIGSSDS